MQKRIMVVDDSRVVHLQVEKMLEGTDYEVVACFRDGENAIDQYDYVQPDVVTMDIIMPGIDGFEAVHNLMQAHPEAKALIVTSMVFDDTMADAAQSGACGFLAKPFEAADIISAFDAILEG